MRIFVCFLACCLLLACDPEVAVEQIDYAPSTEKKDEAFAEAFHFLEGNWEGQVKVFEDLLPATRTRKNLAPLDMSYLRMPGLKLQRIASATRSYTSKNPYFQRVQIQESYYDEDGNPLGEQAYSGVHKVQKGKLWSVLEKNDTLYVMQGNNRNRGGIFWEAQRQLPEAMDYQEIFVQNGVLEMIGYAYDAENNRAAAPRFWYYGRYEKQQNN